MDGVSSGANDPLFNLKKRKVSFNFQKNSCYNNFIRITFILQTFITVFDRISAHSPYSSNISQGNMSIDPVPSLLTPWGLEDSLPFSLDNRGINVRRHKYTFLGRHAAMTTWKSVIAGTKCLANIVVASFPKLSLH